jgi:predicted AlkP superfamily phosphohydrolase/phosphomutase
MAMRAMIIGLDSLVPGLIEKFAGEGVIPNMKKLIDEGTYGEGLCSFPSLTGTNWTTIVSGSWPGTLGVSHMWTHVQGEPLNRVRSSFLSHMSRSETLWKTGERIGKKSIIMKYPCTVPPDIDLGIQVEGTGSPWYGLNPFEIAPCMCFSSTPYTNAEKIELSRANDWKNLPRSQLEPFEGDIEIKCKSTGHSHRYHILIISHEGIGYDQIILSPTKDAKNLLTRLSVGEWSEWLREEFEAKIPQYIEYREDSTTEYEETPTRTYSGTFRFKLMELSPDGERIKLYQSQIFPTKGFAWPDNVSEELVDAIGPFQEHIGPNAVFNNWIDDETFLEELEYQATWLGKASRHLLEKYEWDMFFTQWHGPNHAQHTFWGGIDPISPWYDDSTSETYWGYFKRLYGAADRLVGDLMNKADEDTLIIITADHGHIPYVYGAAMVSNALMKAGLLKYNYEDGNQTIDWRETKAYPLPAHIYVNTRGRDPHGIVEPGEDFEGVKNEIISALHSIRDHEGRCPIAFALKKEDAEMIGLFGDRVGDVIYGNNAGFTSILEVTEDLEPFKFVMGDISVTDDWGEREGQLPANTSIHGSNLPSSKLGLGSIKVPLIMKGPRVREGHKTKKSFRLVDIAPTVAHILEMPFPAQCEGSIMHEILT